VLVLVTGVGPKKATAAINWLLSSPVLGSVPYRPKLVVSAGFAGSLNPRHPVGNIILANEIVDESGKSWPATWPGELPAGEWRPTLHRGKILSIPEIVSSSAKKNSLGTQYNALAVEMESAVIAQACAKAEVPFGCVRAISDDASTDLSPKLVSLISSGGISPWRLLTGLASSPGLAIELRKLAKNTQLAANQLATALGELLTLTLPGN
jgi:adenosylhomocysteine nucleosidase